MKSTSTSKAAGMFAALLGAAASIVPSGFTNQRHMPKAPKFQGTLFWNSGTYTAGPYKAKRRAPIRSMGRRQFLKHIKAERREARTQAAATAQ